MHVIKQAVGLWYNMTEEASHPSFTFLFFCFPLTQSSAPSSFTPTNFHSILKSPLDLPFLSDLGAPSPASFNQWIPHLSSICSSHLNLLSLILHKISNPGCSPDVLICNHIKSFVIITILVFILTSTIQ